MWREYHKIWPVVSAHLVLATLLLYILPKPHPEMKTSKLQVVYLGGSVSDELGKAR